MSERQPRRRKSRGRSVDKTDVNSVTSGNQGKQSDGKKKDNEKARKVSSKTTKCLRSQSEGKMKSTEALGGEQSNAKVTKVSAKFLEDDNEVTMEAEGQLTEFMSEEEEESEGEKGLDEIADEEDDEVTFPSGSQTNNNATITSNSMSTQPINEGQGSGETPSLSKVYAHMVVQNQEMRKQVNNLEDRHQESMNESMDKFQEYMNQRMETFAKTLADSVVAQSRALQSNEVMTAKTPVRAASAACGKASNSNQGTKKATTPARQQGKICGKNNELIPDDQMSEVTIYRNAIEKVPTEFSTGISLRFSSSSDELDSPPFNDSDDKVTSDESLTDKEFIPGEEARRQQSNNKHYVERGKSDDRGRNRSRRVDQSPKPHTSKQLNPGEVRGLQMLRDSEVKKQRIYEVPGKEVYVDEVNNEVSLEVVRNNYERALIADEDYQVVASHVEDSIRQKIINNEYVDFSRLVPRDRLAQVEDHRMVMMHKEGETFFMPAAEKEVSGIISNYYKWEQAFRVFSNIYLNKYPHKAAELIQYNDVIHTTASSYAWENVYRYDREFRLHISRHPDRSWGVVLQQAWNLYIKDRAVTDGRNHNHSTQSEHRHGGGNGQSGSSTRKRICYPFNFGNYCQYGSRCKFEHRCGFCGKWGHGAYACRKAMGKSPGGFRDQHRDSRGDKDQDGRKSDRYHFYNDRKDGEKYKKKES